VQLQGEFAEGRVTYAAGVFNGAPDGRDAVASDPDDEVEFEGRVFFEPWKNAANALSGLGFGLAGSTGDKRGAGNNFLPRYRTPGQNIFFNYRSSVLADGEHQRLSPQFYYYRNRLGLMGEWISSEQEVQVGSNAATHTSLENQAWQLTGSWVLSGEDASYRGVVKPAHPFALDGRAGAPGTGAPLRRLRSTRTPSRLRRPGAQRAPRARLGPGHQLVPQQQPEAGNELTRPTSTAAPRGRTADRARPFHPCKYRSDLETPT
jgi:hypothetical protein